MRPIYAMLAAGIAVAAAPVFAQPPVGDVVDPVASAAKPPVDTSTLTPATREQVRAGAAIRNVSGDSVGTVQSVEGDIAVVIKGGKLYNVPLASLHQSAANGAPALVTDLSQAEIKARTAAGAEVGAPTR